MVYIVNYKLTPDLR